MKLITYKKFKYILSLYDIQLQQVEKDLRVSKNYFIRNFRNESLKVSILLDVANRYGIHPIQFFEQEEVQHD